MSIFSRKNRTEELKREIGILKAKCSSEMMKTEYFINKSKNLQNEIAKAEKEIAKYKELYLAALEKNIELAKSIAQGGSE